MSVSTVAKVSKISAAVACRMVLQAQLLNKKSKLPKGKEGVAQTIEKLGYLQIDTIAVVKRAHHHTLWNRRPDYNESMLDELQAKDQRVFEYWGHAASFLPMSDYRYYLPLMRSFYDLKATWFKRRLEKHGHLMAPVLERIRKEGPLSSRDFDGPADTKREGWWDWKPTKTALELLFWRGELMVRERRNFQRIYDLTERVLPGEIDTSFPNDNELGQFFVRRALSAYGVAEEKHIRQHIPAADKRIISQSLRDLVQFDEVTRVQIEQDDQRSYYALTESVETSMRLKQSDSNVFIISPFDNLIIQRDRTKRLFGFDYTLECYLPADKRKYGYFVLPVLWGEQFIGRLDSKADHSTSTLIIRNLVFEKSCEDFEELATTLAKRLVEFAIFNRCKKIRLDTVKPRGLKSVMRKAVKQVDSRIDSA